MHTRKELMTRLPILLLALVVLGDSAIAQRRGGLPLQEPDQGVSAPQGRQGTGRGGGFQTTGTAVIQGYVIVADTGSPVRRAEVRATSNATRTARVATTDDSGRFVLTDLPAGQWTVTASKGGFVAQQFGQRRPFEVVPLLDLADAERRTINFTLWRGGAITGQVFDEFGDPIAGARLQVLRAQTVDGRPRLVATGMTDQTDDRGGYRLYGLAPGEYYVSATVRAPATSPVETVRALRDSVASVAGVDVESLRDTIASADRATTYAPTYYPGTSRAGEAQPIRLMVPGEEAHASFTLLPVRTVQVTGTVVASGGTPVTATINLRPLVGGDVTGPGGGYSGVSRTDGSFVVSGVVPGAYVVDVTTRGRRSSGTEVASVPVSVGAEGLAGVSVTTGPGAGVTGAVTAASGSLPSTAGIQVLARPMRGGRTVQVTAARDGTFALAGLIGPYTLDVGRVPQGWVLESVVINGVDVTETAMEFRGTEQVTGVRVMLTDRLTEVRGTVTVRAQASADATVVVFPDDPARWASPARFVRTARSDPQGGFTIQGLPPGSYLAVAVNYLQQGESQAREFLEAMRSRATPFTLAAGAQTAVDLRLVER